MRQNIRAFIVADPALGQLYSLRQLVKGASQRQWSISDSSLGEIRLAIGGQALPVFQLTGISGTQAAVGLTSGSFGMYSTRPLSALNSQLKVADGMLGEAAVTDGPQLDWISAQPFSSKNGTIDLVYLQGQNDLNPLSETKVPGQFMRGSMAGAKIAYLLPMRWKMNGEWMTSQVKRQGDSNDNDSELPAANNAYMLTLAGPIAHPFGETNVRFYHRQVGANFQAFNGAVPDAGVASTQLSLTQPFALGPVTGTTQLDWAKVAQDADPNSVAADNTNIVAATSLRWQATPAVAVTAAHKIGTDVTEENPDISAVATTLLKEQETSKSELGLEWKVTPKVSLSLTGAQMSFDEISARDDRFANRLSNRGSQYTLGLKGQSSIASWGLQLERRAALDLMGETSVSSNALSINAQRRLTSWLKMSGTYRFSQCEDTLNATTTNASGLTAAASLSLKEMGNLELSYSQANEALRNGVRLSSTPSSGYSARYIYGPKAGESGLGLSVDYYKQGAAQLNDSQWRVGVTYR